MPRVTVLSPEGANQQNARFSPDGKHVAYWQQGSGVWKLTVASADLTGARTLDSSAAVFSPPLWSPDGTTLAYMAGGDLDIWVVSATGGAPRRLTTGKGVEQPVQWYPRGGRLAYIATGKAGVGARQVDVATATTSPIVGEKRLAIPFWSPDGSKIAYMVVDGGRTTLWIADSTGGNARQLTTEGFERFTPSAGDPWSPDGSQLLYESRRTGFADVWTVSVATDSMRQLTRDVRNDYAAQWSPDGKWVAFLSDRGRQTDIWIVPAAGGTPERVTDNDAVESDVQWVPGTTEIGFSSGGVQRGLWTHALADGSEHRLTADSIRVGGAYDLSPDGKSVVFVNLKGGGVRDLDVVPVSGGTPRTLVSNGAANMSPQWSPDGSKVLYVSDKTGTWDVWVVDSAGGEPTDVTPWPTDESSPDWSRDGHSIYVVSSRDAKPLHDLWEVPADGGEPRRLTQNGTVSDVIVSRASGDVLVRTLSGSEGQISLSRVLPSGRLQTLWDRASVVGISDRWFTPSGDSVAFLVQGSGGSPRTMLAPTHGGEARPFLDENQGVAAWSPDGTKLVYWAPLTFSDLYLKSLTDGKSERLTNTPEDEGGVFWLPGGQSILFYRASQQQRIATVDVGKLMAGPRR